MAHTAVAPPTNIVLNGRVLIRDLANGEFATNVVPAGTYQVAVVPSATIGPPILGPSSLTVKAGQLVNVFAIGDATAGRMDAVVQVLAVGSKGAVMPSKVETGNGGQAAGMFSQNHPGGSAWFSDLMPIALGGVLFAAGRKLRRARRAAG